MGRGHVQAEVVGTCVAEQEKERKRTSRRLRQLRCRRYYWPVFGAASAEAGDAAWASAAAGAELPSPVPQAEAYRTAYRKQPGLICFHM